MIKIDGSHGEGGGSVLRVAAGMSVVTQEPVKVFNIRKNRSTPGLRAQHLHGLKAVAEACGGSLGEARVGSTEIEFMPREARKKKVKVSIPTAGSVGLVLQVLQIACLKAPHEITIEFNGGASWGKWAPPLEYLRNVTYPTLEKMGYNISVNVEREGFYPRGGCQAKAVINSSHELEPLRLLETGKIEKIEGRSVAAKQLKKPRVADRQKKKAREKIFKETGISPEIEAEYVDAQCPGSGICLWAEDENGNLYGGDCVGERGLSSEKVGERAANELIKAIRCGAVVDKNLEDQIIPFLALAPGSEVKVNELTKHSETNIWVVEKFIEGGVSFENGKLVSKR